MYTDCVAQIADNIVPDCVKPHVNGFTGRAILIPWASKPVIVQNGDNPRIITSITPAEGQKVVVIDNKGIAPFAETTTTSNTDDGVLKYAKTFKLRVPRRGAKAAKDIVEPLGKDTLGYLAIIEKKDKVGDGSFEVLGYVDPLLATGDGTNRDEAANNGDVVVTLMCKEQFFEVTLFDTDYNTTATAFEELFKSSF